MSCVTVASQYITNVSKGHIQVSRMLVLLHVNDAIVYIINCVCL